MTPLGPHNKLFEIRLASQVTGALKSISSTVTRRNRRNEQYERSVWGPWKATETLWHRLGNPLDNRIPSPHSTEQRTID